jgi:hypothetical protein
MFCPDESNSNRLNSIFEATKRCSMAELVSIDDELGPDGRVMEVLSEHLCQGWLEGYLPLLLWFCRSPLISKRCCCCGCFCFSPVAIRPL